jgi:hypothetical protein
MRWPSSLITIVFGIASATHDGEAPDPRRRIDPAPLDGDAARGSIVHFQRVSARPRGHAHQGKLSTAQLEALAREEMRLNEIKRMTANFGTPEAAETPH